MPAPVIAIDDLDDPRLAPYRQLKDRHLAEAMGLFIVEGEQLVRRLAAAGPRIEPVSILVSAHRLRTLLPAVPDGVPVYVLPEARISGVVGYAFHRGMLGCGRRPDLSRLDDLAAAHTLVVCPHLQDVENLGGIIRTAAALGVEGLVVGDRGADPFMRRCVRVSMGAVFTLPIVRTGDPVRDLARLRDTHGFDLVATVLDDRATPLRDYRRGERVAVLLGSEPHGLDSPVLDTCTRRVTIPMACGADSLNVAIAAGIVLHHVTAI